MAFHSVEANLRQSFRVLAAGRTGAHVAELPGVSVVSLGVAFQMFNAAFLNGPVAAADLDRRLALARVHFEARGLDWAFWFCEDWLDRKARRRLGQACREQGLRLATELPGMIAGDLKMQKRSLPTLEFRRVRSAPDLADFRGVGSVCFHVPSHWFAEVFHDGLTADSPSFVCWVAYSAGEPVATAASLTAAGAIGLYNIATAPGYRGRGIAEAVTRHVIAAARSEAGTLPLILQSTALGHRLYEKLGFRDATRILVFNSGL